MDPFTEDRDFSSEIPTPIHLSRRLYWRATWRSPITRSSPKIAYLENHVLLPTKYAACCTIKWCSKAKIPQEDRDPSGVPEVNTTSRTHRCGGNKATGVGTTKGLYNKALQATATSSPHNLAINEAHASAGMRSVADRRSNENNVFTFDLTKRPIGNV